MFDKSIIYELYGLFNDDNIYKHLSELYFSLYEYIKYNYDKLQIKIEYYGGIDEQYYYSIFEPVIRVKKINNDLFIIITNEQSCPNANKARQLVEAKLVIVMKCLPNFPLHLINDNICKLFMRRYNDPSLEIFILENRDKFDMYLPYRLLHMYYSHQIHANDIDIKYDQYGKILYIMCRTKISCELFRIKINNVQPPLDSFEHIKNDIAYYRYIGEEFDVLKILLTPF